MLIWSLFLEILLPLVGAERIGGWRKDFQAFAAASAFKEGRCVALVGLEKGKVLVATAQLGDPFFGKTVVILLEADCNGALGLVINRPTTIRFAQAFPDKPQAVNHPEPIFLGGPVATDRVLLIIHSKTPLKETHSIFGNLYWSGDPSVFDQVMDPTKSKDRFRVYIGHAGWAPGQLENEVSRGDWEVLPAKEELVFDPSPQGVWQQLIK